LVRGIPDCWVVVARDEADLEAWIEAESLALEASPLRVCRAVLDDDLLILRRDTEDLDDCSGEADEEHGCARAGAATQPR
jgi:hypothetical protein